MSIYIQVSGGRLNEYNGNRLVRSYAGNFIQGHTDGVTVVGVTQDGQVKQYKKGNFVRNIGSHKDATSAVVTGDIAMIGTKHGKVRVYKNGNFITERKI